NLIYGLNGSGKSTFSNYFYDLENTKYNKCSNTNGGETILVYNQKFISNNFYSPDSLNGIFGLSEENKHVEEVIKQKTEELKELEEERNNQGQIIEKQVSKVEIAKTNAEQKVWEIKQTYTGGDRVLEYCLESLKGNKSKLYEHISALSKPETKPEKTIDSLKAEINAIDGDAAVKLNTLDIIMLDNLSNASVEALNEIVVGNKDSPVADLIEKLQNSDWVSSGLEYLELVDSNECPFCQSKTITEQLTQQIKDYFDESYEEKITAIKSIETEYGNLVENFPTLDSYKSSQYATEHLAKLTEEHSLILKAIEQNKDLIQKKKANPSTKITLTDPSTHVENFNALVLLVNGLINEHNLKIDNASSEKARIKKAFWEILRYEYDQTISNHKKIGKAAQTIIDSARLIITQKAKDIAAKEQEIIEQQKNTVNIDEAVQNISKGLEDIGITDFTIMKHENNLYRVVRSGADADVFTSLSEGEKMMISFLYFRELFKGKLTATEVPQKKIAIIDDPVSSLSHIFVYNIGRLIKNDFFMSDDIEQVFVLTHSLYFFYELTDTNHGRRKKDQKLFRLSKNSLGSSISKMSYQEVQNDYQSYWSVINDGEQPPALIANCMRNVIEYFFGFVQKIELSNVADIEELQQNKFQAFMRYINRESHSVGQNIIDFKEFDYDIFREAFKLLFYKAGYPEHYDKMSEIS
ncbi:AAA family ATPase, partial [Shewanella abyssi]|uniref:AAA family ATPase n=1 Tax=Shewanella abyssi TaxID=311789 RepID=UPI00200BE0D1